MKLLHIDSSILGDQSVSRAVSAAIVQRFVTADPNVQVVTRDLASEPLSHLSGAYLAGRSAEVKHDQAMQDDVALGGKILDEFLAADLVVIGAPMYNFTISSHLKAWVDRVLVAGKTFRYTDHGAEGLAGGKRVIVAIARGGIYSAGSPHASAEHAETYLETVFGFIGIRDLEFVVAEGLALGPEKRDASRSGAIARASALPTAA